MICGIDHIALACADLDAGARAAEAAGFGIRFTDRDVPNDAGKRGILEDYRALHSMAVCDASPGVSLELTVHGPRLAPGRGGYQPLFRRPTTVGTDTRAPTPDRIGEVWSAATGARALPVHWSDFSAPCWQLAPDEAGHDLPDQEIMGLLLPAPQIGREAAFWTDALGFRPVDQGEIPGLGAWTLIRMAAPLPNWSGDVILFDDGGAPPPAMLDSEGFPCLALLSTSMSPDLARCLELGAELAAPQFAVVVNGKSLNVAIVRSPGGALIELLNVERGQN